MMTLNEPIRFGVAKDLITPDQRMSLSGYSSYFNRPFTGIHDDLYVRSLWMDDGRSQLLLVSLDLLFHDAALTETVQAWAEQEHGIPPERLFLTYSHTHGGPAIRGYDDASQFNAEYESFLLARIQSCISRAMVNVFEGQLEYGSVTGDWNINRRRPIDGVFLNSPNPEGPKDDQLHVLRVTDTSGKTRAVLTNYACHPVTVRDTPYISGDFPGRVCQLLEAEYFGAVGLFFQGAGGNSRPKATAYGGTFITCDYASVDEMAVSMTLAIKRLCRTPGGLSRVEPALDAAQFDIELELDPFPKAEFEAAVRDGYPGLRGIAAKVLERYDDMADTLPLRAGLVRLSEGLHIAYMGGEPCYEVKRKLEAQLGGSPLLFFGYADAIAYIPDDSIIAEGGYEAEGSVIEYGNKGPFKPGVDARMAEAFLKAKASMQ